MSIANKGEKGEGKRKEPTNSEWRIAVVQVMTFGKMETILPNNSNFLEHRDYLHSIHCRAAE